MKRLGFIGMGNMASAIAKGFLQNQLIAGENVLAYAPHQEKLRESAARLGFTPCASLAALAEACDTLVMACKPYQIEEVLQTLGQALSGKTLLSIAAGWDFARYAPLLPDSVRFQFIMPNTPAMVGAGVLLFEEQHSLLPNERQELMQLFSAVGRVVELPTHLMGIGSAVSGCGPAFVDLMLEGFADAAVKYGISRPLAYELVSQTVLGSAKLQLDTASQPGVLKDAVCSPAGTTIRGVCALEKAGFRSACVEAIDAVMGVTQG